VGILVESAVLITNLIGNLNRTRKRVVTFVKWSNDNLNNRVEETWVPTG
jgi:hypothetical protein